MDRALAQFGVHLENLFESQTTTITVSLQLFEPQVYFLSMTVTKEDAFAVIADPAEKKIRRGTRYLLER